MLYQNNQNSILFYSLLGDYYIYMYKKNEKSDCINTGTSILLEEIFEDTSHIINSSFLYKNTTSLFFIGTIEYIDSNTVRYFDINGKEINPTSVYILNRENDIIFNTLEQNEIIKYLQKNKLSSSLIYYTKEQKLNVDEIATMFNVTDVDVSKFIAYLMYKMIQYNVYNKTLVNNLIAIYFNTPFCLTEKEKILKYQDGKVITDVNEYEIIHDVYIKKEGDIKFGEPLYYISKINNSNSSVINNIVDKMFYIDNYSNAFYLNKLKTYVTSTFLNASISVDVLIQNPEKGTVLANIFKNISYIDASLNTYRDEEEEIGISLKSDLKLIEKGLFEAKETTIITIHYYDKNINAITLLDEKLKVIEKGKADTFETELKKGVSLEKNGIDAIGEDKNKEYAKENLLSIENSKLTALWEKFNLKNLIEKGVKKIIYSDTLKYPKNDNLKYKYIITPTYNVIEKYIENISYFAFDFTTLPTDDILTKIYNINTSHTYETLKKQGFVEKSESNKMKGKEALKYLSLSLFSGTELTKNKTVIDRSLLRTRDTLGGDVRLNKEETNNLLSSNKLSKKISNVFIQKDELIMDSNTLIDEKK